MLPLLAAAAPGIISGVASLFGAKRRRREEENATNQIKQLSDVFNQQLSGGYFNTNEAKGAITQIEDNQRQNQQAIFNSAASSGMTDEAKIAMMGRNNEATANAMGGLAQNADLWRSRLLNQKQGTLQNLYQIGQNNRKNFNESIANIVNPLSESLGSAMNAGVFDKFM